MRWADERTRDLRLEGGWFELRCETFPGTAGTVYDVVLNRDLSAARFDRSRDGTLLESYGGVISAVEKQQLSRAKLKRADLLGVAAPLAPVPLP